MNRNEIEENVRNFLIEDLEIDEEKITPDALLKEDLGIDSLDFVDIVVIVERNFGFKIKPEEMKGVDTYSKFCDYMDGCCGGSSILCDLWTYAFCMSLPIFSWCRCALRSITAARLRGSSTARCWASAGGNPSGESMPTIVSSPRS